VAPGGTGEARITVTNLAESNVCLVGPVWLSEDTLPAFSLPAFASGTRAVEVKGGESLDVAVRLQVPTDATPGHVLEGSMELSISSPTRPRLTVPLTATVAE
jgi:hypothetical protein